MVAGWAGPAGGRDSRERAGVVGSALAGLATFLALVSSVRGYGAEVEFGTDCLAASALRGLSPRPQLSPPGRQHLAF